MSSREEMLARIRTELGGDGQRTAGPGPTNRDTAAPADGSGRAYRTRGGLDRGQLLDLLAERLIDYRASVRRTAPGQLAAAIGAALTQRGARRVVVPPGKPPARGRIPAGGVSG